MVCCIVSYVCLRVIFFRRECFTNNNGQRLTYNFTRRQLCKLCMFAGFICVCILLIMRVINKKDNIFGANSYKLWALFYYSQMEIWVCCMCKLLQKYL